MPDRMFKPVKGKAKPDKGIVGNVADDLRDIVHHFSGGKSVLQHGGESYDEITDSAERGALKDVADKIRKKKAAQ